MEVIGERGKRHFVYANLLIWSKSPVIETAINLKARFSLGLSHFKITL